MNPPLMQELEGFQNISGTWASCTTNSPIFHIKQGKNVVGGDKMYFLKGHKIMNICASPPRRTIKFDSENPSKPEPETSASLCAQILTEIKKNTQQFSCLLLQKEQSSCHLLCDLEVSHLILQQHVLIFI